MKQFLLLILFVTIQCVNVFGQSTTDTISIGNNRGDIKCYQNGVLLTHMDYKEIFKNHPEALQEYLRANSNYKVGQVFAYIGGFVTGFCLGSAISGDKVDGSWWATLGSGAAVISIGAAIYNSGKSHHRNAVSIYNSSLRQLSYHPERQLEFGTGYYGLGLAYKF